MKANVEKDLQKGIKAHSLGNLQEAERVYRAILQSYPKHPDANHNLGLIAISVNQVTAALPLFKTALDVNPNIEQFWVSYIDVLIKNDQLKSAKQAIKKAKNKGFNVKQLEALLSQSKGATHSKVPSQKQLTTLMAHCQNGMLNDAEHLARSITQGFPKHHFAWEVLGAVLGQSGRYSEALGANQTLVVLSPQDANAHYNLGVTLKELGRLDESVISYKKAITLKTDFVEAYSNLGVTLQELGRLEEAEASCMQAIAFQPGYAEAHYNLGVTLEKLDRLDEACFAYVSALNLKPGLTQAYVNASLTFKNLRFNLSYPQLYPILINLLTTGNFTRPNDIAISILSLLKHDPIIKELLHKKNNAIDLKGAPSTIVKLDKLKLIHHLMRVCPLPDLEFEAFFVAMRSFLLTNLDMIETSPELIYFLSTLSLHCFTNEYVYFESDKEMQLIDKLQARIADVIAQSEQPEVIEILCLASYRSLHKYDWCQKLTTLDYLEEVKTRLIEEPLGEKVMVKDIAVLKSVSDDVSLKVRAQYEENPYPRWVKLAIPIKKQSIAEVCDSVHLNLHSESIKEVTAPIILVAGCGTGQHSIETASRFSDCQVTAVDLSLSSLAYAKRKANELNISNLEFLQADILDLHQLAGEFDVIESVGVLHHMNEPMDGWKILTNLLKSGGLMRIGLYSELARSDVVNIRKKIALLEVGTSEEEIRKFRQTLVAGPKNESQRLSELYDFFSLSTLRDLIFHVQEHRFTLPQIQDCLNQLGLKFCGFEGKDITTRFKRFHSVESDICDLTLWHHFEENNPDTFAGMYQFWCQKL